MRKKKPEEITCHPVAPSIFFLLYKYVKVIQLQGRHLLNKYIIVNPKSKIHVLICIKRGSPLLDRSMCLVIYVGRKVNRFEKPKL